MDNAQLSALVLEKLARWKRLTLSDVLTMLPVVERPRLRREILDDLERQGRITIRWVGDEQVLTLVEPPAVADGPHPAP
jgi:cell division FtsZ-interacting protein ZapD